MAAQLITKDTTIGEILQKYPDAAEIMQSYGLRCFGCFVNLYESLEQGVLGHGMNEEVIKNLLKDLNELANSPKETTKEQCEEDDAPVVLTELAAAKLKELLEKQDRKDQGIRVEVAKGGCAGYVYNMDFAQVKQDDDTILEQHGVRLFVDAESLKMLRGVIIDYIETSQGAGFKFKNTLKNK
jgi:iron-sulfur cluster assembly accessory protein